MNVFYMLEEMFDNDLPVLQHTWTMISLPQENLSKEPFVYLMLDRQSDSGKLIKCTFG